MNGSGGYHHPSAPHQVLPPSSMAMAGMPMGMGQLQQQQMAAMMAAQHHHQLQQQHSAGSGGGGGGGILRGVRYADSNC